MYVYTIHIYCRLREEIFCFWEDAHDSRVYVKLKLGGLCKALSLTLMYLSLLYPYSPVIYIHITFDNINLLSHFIWRHSLSARSTSPRWPPGDMYGVSLANSVFDVLLKGMNIKSVY